MIFAVSLRLLYVIFQHTLGLLLLMGRPSSTKDIELLVLRHEVAVLRRTNPRPRLQWAGRVRRTHPAAAPGAEVPSLRHPEHHPGLAPPSRAQEMDLPEPIWPPTEQRPHRRAGRAHGDGEPELGLPQSAGRTAQTRPPGRRHDDPEDPEAPPHPTGTRAALRHHLATVPAHPSRRHARRRLLPRRLRGDATADLRLVPSRGRRSPPARPGCDGASRRTLDHPAGPQPRHGPRRTRRAVPVPG